MPLDTTLIFMSILLLCLYNILLKKVPEKLILLFWVNLLSYLRFIVIYVFRTSLLNHDLHAFRELIFNYILDDFPLYVIIAVSFLGSMIISEKLLDGYDLSLVIPISQLGILFAGAGYVALGDPFKWSLIFGVLILCLGVVIISFSTTISSPGETILSRLKKIQKQLLFLVLVQSILFTISSIVSYLGTKETTRTDMIMNGFKHLHIGPIAFHGAFYFNLGQQMFGVVIFMTYILARRQYRQKILSPIRNSIKSLSMVVIAYLVAEYAYFTAFMLTTDTTILLVLDNLSIPITIVFSFVMLKEHVSMTKIIGSSLIILGGLIAAF